MIYSDNRGSEFNGAFAIEKNTFGTSLGRRPTFGKGMIDLVP